MSVPLQRQLACAQRTIERERRRVARLEVTNKPFNRHAWLKELENMEAIVESLQKLVWLEEVSEEIKRDTKAKRESLCAQAAQSAEPAEP